MIIKDDKFDSSVSNFFDIRYFSLVFAIACTFLTYICFFPDYHNIEEQTYERIDLQIDQPFEKVDYPVQNHWAKRQLRLTIPIIANSIGIKGIGVFYLQQLLLTPFFYLVYGIAFSILKNKLNSIIFTVGIAFVYVSKSFLQTEPLHDAFAFFFLIIPFKIKQPIVVFSSIFLACFIDERAAIASIGILLFFFFESSHLTFLKRILQPVILGYIIVPIAVILTRYYLYLEFGLSTPIGKGTGVDLTILLSNFNLMPISFMSAFEGYWVLVGVGFLYLLKRKAYFQFLSYIGFFLLILVSSYLVIDLTRSLAYGFPLIFLFLRDLSKVKNKLEMRRILTISSGVSFLIPTYYMWGGDMNVIYWMSPVIPKICKFLF